jgi:hypothetical protein
MVLFFLFLQKFFTNLIRIKSAVKNKKVFFDFMEII